MKNIFNIIVFLFVFAVINCETKAIEAEALGTNIKKDSIALRKNVSFLADFALEGRLTGSKGDSIAASYINNIFLDAKLSGFNTNNTEYKYWLPYTMKASWGDSLFTRNVSGYVVGTDSLLKDRYIIIGAHFDHLGYGDKTKSSMKPEMKQMHPGADDNASGVSVLLELSKYFSLKPQKRTIVFVAFSGEEIGLCGSSAFLKQIPFKKDKIDAMINLDMLGGLTDSVFTVSGIGTMKEGEECLKNIGLGSGVSVKHIPGGHGPSDHAMFYAENIPVLFFATPPTPVYHTPYDTVGGLNYGGMARLMCVLKNTVEALSEHNSKFTFVSTGSAKPAMTKGKFEVTLGLMPDINATEESTNFGEKIIAKGLKAMLVVEGKPAYKAGLRSGDILLSIDGQGFSTIEGYMKVLSSLKKGQKIKLKAIVNGKQKTFKIQL